MRRHALDALVASFDDEQVPVGDARVEADPPGAQPLVEEADQLVGLLGRDVAGGMILQDIALHADEVAAHRHLVGLEVYADAGRLQYAPALVHGGEVVAQYGHVRYLAARMETVRHGSHPPGHALARQEVHVGRARVAHGGLAAQSLYRLVGHAIA